MSRPHGKPDAQLVDAAARAIGIHGPQALTLADVARESGVSPGLLAQRFGSKRGLLLAVAAQRPPAIEETFAIVREREPPPLAALEAALTTLASSVGGPDQVANHLAFRALYLADADFRRLALREMHVLSVQVDALLREALSVGDVTPAARRALGAALPAAYLGTLHLWAIGRTGTAPGRMRAQVRALLRVYAAATSSG